MKIKIATPLKPTTEPLKKPYVSFKVPEAKVPSPVKPENSLLSFKPSIHELLPRKVCPVS